VSLPGRYLVYVPEGSMTGISRKLPDTERARLKQILKKIVPEDAGVIVRTAAEGASEDELARDVERLQSQWEEIQRKAKTGNAPTLLYGEPDMTVRVVRDIFNEDFSKVVVSGDKAWDTISGYVSQVAPDLAGRLSRWTSDVDVFATYRIDEQLMKALDRKVWLPSGGSLVIDKTEAMVVIDVNTGKFTGQGGNLEETVTRNNLEAAEEIVRQLRLRDLGGIVVVDFIDMVLESNRDLVMRRLLECLGRDRTKHQVAEVTSLGLIQMTRKRVGQGLLESFSETCVHCNGRGVIVHMDQATAPGGGGKRKRRGAKNAELDQVVAATVAADTALTEDTEAVADALAEVETEADKVAEAVGAVESAVSEEWYGSPEEAEAAASRGRSGRRGRRRAVRETAAVTDPQLAESAVLVEEAAPALPTEPAGATEATEAEAAPAEPAPAEPVSAPAEAAPARTRRRAVRKASAPAGSPVSAEAEPVVVVPAAEPAPEPVAEPEPGTAAAEPAAEPRRARRRVTRTVTAPAGEAAVVVVPATGGAEAGAESAPETASGEPEPAPRKRASRKKAVAAPAEETRAEEAAPAEDTAAEQAPARKTAARKAPAKKAAGTKATAKAPAKKAATTKATAKSAATAAKSTAKKATKKSAAKKSASAADQTGPATVSADAGDGRDGGDDTNE
jgi:ribonuclease E